MTTDAHAILDHLAAAFGGHSQVHDSIVGSAIFGRANNASTAWPVEAVNSLIDDCAALIDERFPADESARARIIKGYRAAWRRHESTLAPKI